MINKIEVEQIGEQVSMSSAEANTNFFALRGSVWDVRNMDSSLIDSDESRALPSPRDWLGINDDYLVS